MVSASPTIRFLVAGSLRRDFLVLADSSALIDALGGSLVYAGSGLGLWENGIGLLGRVGTDYPRQWLEGLSICGFDTQGIRILPEAIDLRAFTAYTDNGTAMGDDPVGHFARLGLPFPRPLLGYVPPGQSLDSRTRPALLSVRVNDIPSDYLNAGAAHLCPMDFLTHNLLPSTFRQGHITTLTLDPGAGYMDSAFWDFIPAIVNGLTAFLTNEVKLRSLFQNRSNNLWEMMEAVAAYGCEIIVVKRGDQGQLLYDAASRTRWTIPAYPARPVNPTGCGDSLCGGFLAGYRRTYDPLPAVLYGNISASFTLEGRTPLYTKDALPRLAEARLDAIQNMVRKA
jgi:sugar/nucleoside kinase (ribokinase family)